MLRSTCLVIAIMALASAAAAQDLDDLQTLDDLIDFVLRPGEDPVANEEDVWTWDTEPEPSLVETEIGPQLAGPDGEEQIGPALLGPDAPLDEPERAALQEEQGDDPFAAIGVQLGSFVFRPSIEAGLTATDNVTGEEDGPGAIGLVLAPALNVRQKGDRHELEADLSAEGVFYDDSQYDLFPGAARVTGRYNLSDQTALVGEAGYSRYYESFSDDDTPAGAAERPAVDAFAATLGVERSFGRLTTVLSGLVDRTAYQDVPLTGGGTASRKGEDNTEYGGRLRTGYLLGAGIAPFVETAGGRRDYDEPVDADGFRRSSVWGELRGGIAVNRGEKLSGEVSVGYHHEVLEDDALPNIDAPLVNAAILWSPRRLTVVQVDLYTAVQPTSVPDESGTLLYSGLVTVSRSITPRFKLAGGGGVVYQKSVGGDWHDVTFTGLAEASYAFNRVASVAATYQYDRTESTQPGRDSQAHTVGVRVRVQR